MPIYTCPKCDSKFLRKDVYQYHVNERKFPCSYRDDNIAKDSKTSNKYKCDGCSKLFSTNGNLKRHLNGYCPIKNDRGIPNDTSLQDDNTENDNSTQDVIIDDHKCKYCDATFSRSDALARHIAKYCKAKKQDDEKKFVYQDLLHEMNEIKKQNIELAKRVNMMNTQPTAPTICSNNSNSNNGNNKSISIQNVTNDIKVVAFGNEDLYSLITDEEAKKYLKKGYQSVYELVNDVHFDPDKPEMHNVYISNLYCPYAIKYNGDDWDAVEKEDLVDQLFDDKACYLNSIFKELKRTLDSKTISKYSRFMNETDSKVIDKLKNDIKLLLYNKRNIPMKTKKQIASASVATASTE